VSVPIILSSIILLLGGFFYIYAFPVVTLGVWKVTQEDKKMIKKRFI